jgi:hypothetical protein
MKYLLRLIDKGKQDSAWQGKGIKILVYGY